MRIKQPNIQRPFRVPALPLVAILGVLVCGAMIVSLDSTTQLTALAWMVIGLLIYFGYSRSRSKHKHDDDDIIPTASHFEKK